MTDHRSLANHPAHILVVDDSPEDREQLSDDLLATGHEVDFATDGREAIAIVEKHPQSFDLILLDSNMPGMNGDEVLAYLKQDMQTTHIPIIIVSGNSDLDYVGRCIELGAEDYLPKPWNLRLLNARVSASLRRKWMEDQERDYFRKVQEERRRADKLLNELFPSSVAQELRANGKFAPRRFLSVAVMFCDITGFTPHCDRHQAETVVEELRLLFEAFDRIAVDHAIEKIKTIGDAYMAAAGLLQTAESPVLNCIRCGQAMIEAAQALPSQWQVTVGIHSGPVVGGVVGQYRYQFDIWGSTVNAASRIQSLADPGSIDLSAAAWQEVAQNCRGSVRTAVVKGLGEIPIIRFGGFRD